MELTQLPSYSSVSGNWLDLDCSSVVVRLQPRASYSRYRNRRRTRALFPWNVIRRRRRNLEEIELREWQVFGLVGPVCFIHTEL
jgi:hypothetical protein